MGDKYRLYHGDCLEVMKGIEAGSVDLIVTSPPYFNAMSYNGASYDSISSWENTIELAMGSAFRLLSESRMCIVNISNIIQKRESRAGQSKRIPLAFFLFNIMDNLGYEFLEDIVWKKPAGAVPNRNGNFFSHRKPLAYKPNLVTEYIFVFKKPSTRLLDCFLRDKSPVLGEYEKTNVWEICPANTSNGHPCPFPIEIPDKLIKYYSYEGDTVLDPFMGSGTTGHACAKTNRRFIGIEQDADYFRIAEQRVKNAYGEFVITDKEKATGQMALFAEARRL